MTDRTGRRRRRWIIGTSLVLVLVVAGVLVAGKPSAGPAAAALPSEPAAAPVGPFDGTRSVGPGSYVGFRVFQKVFGQSSDIAGRTGQVTGTATVTGGRLTAASWTVAVTTLTVGSEPSEQFDNSLDVAREPTASFQLTAPVDLTAGITGQVVTGKAAGRLTLHGVTRPVTVDFTGRRAAATIQVAGSLPITFADWGITPPDNYGVLGSLAGHGIAEFYLILV